MRAYLTSVSFMYVCVAENAEVRSHKKKTILFGNFSQHGGGVFPNPKTFVNLKNSAFLGQKQCFLGKKCTITWYILHISYFIFHISYCIFHIFWIRGSQKGGGSDVCEKFPNNIVFFV